MADRSLVRNAADPEQVKRAGRVEKRRDDQRFHEVRHQLSTYEGRAFVWGELVRHYIFASVTALDTQIYVLSGWRDAGLPLHDDVSQHPALYMEMWNEAMARRDRDNRETDAVHTRAVEQETTTT